MKVLLLNNKDSEGGAARAVYRLHKAFKKHSIESTMRVGTKNTDDPSVVGPQSTLKKFTTTFKEHFAFNLMKLQHSRNYNLHSPALFNSGIVKEINTSDADVIQLNWICDEFLSVEDIGKIKKPVVWRFSDMWPFSGAEHYGDDGPDARWRKGYTKNNRPNGHKGLDIDRWVWKRKKRSWKRKIHVITPSQWMADCVKASDLMGDWPVTVIPTTLDLKQFKPWNKKLARDILQLPQTSKLILFGAIGGTKYLRKGSDLLVEALQKLSTSNDNNLEGVIFGQSSPENKPDFGIPIHWKGVIKDDVTLSLLYSAADVMVVPSRQDNLPQTAIEAQSCGCPLVAFNISGMPDALLHKKTGYLANPFDTDDLAEGIKWILKNHKLYHQISQNARERAQRLWNSELIVEKFLQVYEKAISHHNSTKNI